MLENEPEDTHISFTPKVLQKYGFFVIALLLAVAFLILDAFLPLGIAGGVAYVAVVLFGLWFPYRRQVIAITVICVVLVLMGYFISPESGIAWKVYFNRALSIFAIITTGSVIYYAKTAALNRDRKAHTTFMPMARTAAPEHTLHKQFSTVGYYALIAGFPVLLLVVLASFWVTEKQEDARKWVLHTHEVQVSLSYILSSLQDAETGQRGYLLTGKEQYLEPFNNAIGHLFETVAIVRNLTMDNPSQQQRLDRAVPLIDEKLEELKNTIALFKTKGFEAALSVVNTDQGKEVMDQLRIILDEMKAEEAGLLRAREQTLQAGEAIARTVSIIGFALIILISILVFFKIRTLMALRDEDERQLYIANVAANKANAELQYLSEDLERQIKARTKELNASLASLRKISQTVDQSPSMMFITNTDGDIEYANDKLYEVTGYTPEDVIGQNPRIFKSGKTPRSVYEGMWKTIKNGGVWCGEIEDYDKNGNVLWVDITITPIHSEDGTIINYAASHVDITKRKSAEAKMYEATNRAVVANRAKTDLMANMSHELRTPLNAIIGFSSTIKEEIFGPIGNEKYMEYLNDIHNSGQHLLDLINDILDVSAIEVGALHIDKGSITVSDVIDASIRLIIPRADEGKVTIASSVGTDIPLLFADKRRLKQIFLNLLSTQSSFL